MDALLETERLILRSVYPQDYLSIFAWAGDEKVAKFMKYSTHKNPEVTKEWLVSRNIDNPNECDLGIIEKQSGELIGMGGLVLKGDGIWVLGYNLRADKWGKGYCAEAMKAIIDYVCSVKDVRIIESSHAIDNPKSGRVMEKLGLTFYCDSEYSKFDGSEHFKAKTYRMKI